MANGNDAYLDELARATKGGGVAVAEPDESDAYLRELSDATKPPEVPKENLSEVKPFATQATPGGKLTDRAAALGKSMLPPLPQPKQDLSQVKPFATQPGKTLSQQSENLGALPFEPPTPAVRGQFGQPIYPLPVQQKIEQQQAKEFEAEDAQQQEELKQQNTSPTSRFVQKTIENVEKAFSQPKPSPIAPKMPEGMTSPVDTLRAFWEGPGTIRPALEEFANAHADRAMLKSTSELLSPDNLLLLAGMEGLPPAFVSSPAAKVIVGGGFTAQMAHGLIQQYPEFRDAIANDNWDQAATIAAGALPTVLFTALGLKNVFEGFAQGVGITKGYMNAWREFDAQNAARAATAKPEPKLLTEKASTEPELHPDEPGQSSPPETREKPPESPEAPPSEQLEPVLPVEAPTSDKLPSKEEAKPEESAAIREPEEAKQAELPTEAPESTLKIRVKQDEPGSKEPVSELSTEPPTDNVTAQIKEFSDVIRDPNSTLEQREVARTLRQELRTKRRELNKSELEAVLGSMQSKIRDAADAHYRDSIPIEAALQDATQKLTNKKPASELPTEPPARKKSTRELLPEPEPETQYPADIVTEAKLEIEEANSKWQTFERPGRHYLDLNYETGREASIKGANYIYPVKSARPDMEAAHPWLKKPEMRKMTAGKMGEAVARGKGVEYRRLVNAAAAGILKERESSKAVLAEHADALRQLAQQVRETDPEGATALESMADGNVPLGIRNMRDYVEGKITDAETAIAFGDAIDRAADEAREAGFEDTAADDDGALREEGILPGLETAVRDERAAVGREQARNLTDKINEPGQSIEAAAGEMESKSPLFRGTDASPQKEMFSPAKQESKPKKSRGPKKITTDDVIAEAYKPGNIVKSYYGYDKIIHFDPGDSDRGFNVQAIATDKDGNPLPGERVRSHKTMPDKQDMTAARKRLEERQAEATRTQSVIDKGSRLSAGFDPTVVKDLLASFAKDSTPSQSNIAKGTIRERTGQQERANQIASHMLKAERARADKWDIPKSLDFIGRMESGREQVTPEDRKLADILRGALDDARERVQNLGTGKLSNFIENYFPHIWEDPDKAKDVIARIMGKRPMQGPASFIKKRTIPTTDEGIKAGLKPVTYNPVDLSLLKIREMNRYVMAHQVLLDLMNHPQKLARFVFFGKDAPEGWVPLQDRMFTVYGPPTIPVKEYYDENVWNKLHTLADNLGIKHERDIAIGGTRLGYTSQGDDTVTTRFATPEAVIAHEIGHQMDFRYGLKGKLVKTSPYREELRKLVDLKWEGKKVEEVPASFRKYVRKGVEKMATMIEALVHAPDKFQEVAPETWKFLQGFIAAHPELKPLLETTPSMVYGQRQSEVSAGGLVIRGQYYAPREVAKVVDRFLSPGLRGDWRYDLLRDSGNMLNQAQLGLSAFHLMFTSMDATVSDMALAIEKISRGDVKGAARLSARAVSLAGSPIGTYLKGSRVLAEYMSPGKYKELGKLADAVAQGGGRAQMDKFYKSDSVQAFWKAWKEGNWGKVGLRALPAALEKAASPIMEHIVPRMKLGVFANLAQDILARLPEDASHDEINQALDQAWDSVDNRMGQMVYDNLFWNKTVKDIGMISVRSLGWNMGTVREIGGGAKDFAQQAANAASGQRPEVTHRMAYSMALPMMVGLAGAVLMYLATGKAPQELKDYFYPQNGKSDTDGNPERVALPSYVKDVVGFAHAPIKTSLDKFHPLFHATAEMLSNKDFYGNKIHNEDDPTVVQVKDIVEYIAKAFVPFSARNAAQQAQEQGEEQGLSRYLPDTREKAERFLGILPAPAYITRTPAETKISEYLQQRSEQGGRTKEQAARYAEERRLSGGLRSGNVTEQDVRKSAEDGKITQQQAKTIVENKNTSAIERVRNLSAQQALNVYDIATPQEREKIIPFLRTKATGLDNLDADTRKDVETRMASVFKDTGNDAFIPGAVDEELERLHYQGLRTATSMQKEIRYEGRKFPLSDEEQGEYQQLRATAARAALKRMFSSSAYKPLSDEEKLIEVRGQVKDADAYAAEQMMTRLYERRVGRKQTEAPQYLPMEAPQ